MPWYLPTGLNKSPSCNRSFFFLPIASPLRIHFKRGHRIDRLRGGSVQWEVLKPSHCTGLRSRSSERTPPGRKTRSPDYVSSNHRVYFRIELTCRKTAVTVQGLWRRSPGSFIRGERLKRKCSRCRANRFSICSSERLNRPPRNLAQNRLENQVALIPPIVAIAVFV
jgi:hypothetical protein